MESQDYIANCVGRIISAPCAPAQQRRREVDLAYAVRLAARDGEQRAHEYLIDLSSRAEDGMYAPNDE